MKVNLAKQLREREETMLSFNHVNLSVTTS